MCDTPIEAGISGGFVGALGEADALLVVALGDVEVDSGQAEDGVDDGAESQPKVDTVALGCNGDPGRR